MKKRLLTVLAVVIVAAAVLVGSTRFGPHGPKVENPFTLDYKLTAENVKFFTDSDDMATLLACSPFYAGAQPLPGQNTQEFDEARAKKCADIIADSDKLAEDALKLKPGVDELREALLDYLTVCVNNEPKAETFVKDAGKEVLRVYTLEAVVEAQYKSIDASSRNGFARTFMEYMKTARAVDLASLYLQDIDDIVAISAMGLEGLSKTKNARIAAANKKLDEAMSKFDAMKGDIEKVAAGMRTVDYEFKQLATGDYYYARAAVKFMRDSMPKLKQAAKSIVPNEYMDAETVALTKDYLAEFDSFSAGFQRYLDSVPETELVPVSLTPDDTVGDAFAADGPGDYASAYLSVSQPGADPGGQEESWLATGWNGVKKTVHGTQSVVGLGLDVAGTTVKNLSQIGTGIYYGNSPKEIWEDMNTNARQIRINWEKNKSGSATMRTAKQYLDAVDDGADWLAAAGAEKAFGKGWTSWGVGKIGKATAGMFTGFGKGLTLIGDRQANASDYAIGSLEIGASMIGGSKLVIKGSQLPEFLAGLGKGTWLSTKGAWNAVSKMLTRMERSEIDEALRFATRHGLQTAGFTSRQAVNDAMVAAIQQSNAALRAEMANIIKAGAKAGWANFNKTLRESLDDFVKKQFTNNIRGLADALASAVGKSAAEFGDNVVGSWADDVLKELVDQAMAEAPLAEELGGTWTGTTVFNSIEIPQAAAEKAKREGCDLAGEIKKLEGQSLPTTMSFDGSSSGSGGVVIRMSFPERPAKPMSARYSYEAGILTITVKMTDGALTMQGNATRMTQGCSVNGSVDAAFGNAAGKITMSGTFEISKPN